MRDFTFYLGLHQPNWLRQRGLFAPGTCLFYSFNTLVRLTQYWPAEYPVRMDSGMFTLRQRCGPVDVMPVEWFASRAAAICRGLGTVDGFAIQDWMCEPQVIHGLVKRRNPNAKRKPTIEPVQWLKWARTAGPMLAEAVHQAESLGDFQVIFHGTGLSVEEHQHRTVQSYLALTKLAPTVPWFPVLQGWKRDEYFQCWDMYEQAGVELRALPVVAVGSTCRRHNTQEVEDLVVELHRRGLRNLHMLGMKTEGLRRCLPYVRSADSAAGSFAARAEHIIMPGCEHGVFEFRERLGRNDWGNCANCPRWLRHWYEKQMSIIDAVRSRAPKQISLFPLDRSAA